MRVTDAYEELCDLCDQHGWRIHISQRPAVKGPRLWAMQITREHPSPPIRHVAQNDVLLIVLDSLVARVRREMELRHWI